ncbi:HAD-IIB family hydrolase [Alteromonadaceae bacterium M269]|nr:HAD-IIB family hydrolase [Alteromonadaceae bacterium M269]
MFSEFVSKHALSGDFIASVDAHYRPLCERTKTHQNSARKPLFVGINGSQGSGKSTLADFIKEYLSSTYKLNVVVISLDDFYFDQKKRQELAEDVHPLLATRGVPGTHDTACMSHVFEQLRRQDNDIRIPRFNKATDNPFPKEQWSIVTSKTDIVIVEGWCWGVNSQTQDQLDAPINQLEAEHDASGLWRYYVNQQLHQHYQPLYQYFDYWIMLKAPSFRDVYAWRLEQETKLKDKVGTAGNTGIMSPEQIKRFIQYYERLTKHSLKTVPSRCNDLFELDAKRAIVKHTQKPSNSGQTSTQYLIYTDMDGTLLDHHTYSFAPAWCTLKKLKESNTPVIPNTSKTFAELAEMREALELGTPFIVENGAAVYIPKGHFNNQPEGTEEKGDYWVKAFSEPRSTWLQLLEQLRPEFDGCFTHFAQMTIADIVKATGLSNHNATLASQREYSEPILWLDDEETKTRFVQAIKDRGTTPIQGGRFLHLSSSSNKGLAMKWLTDQYKKSNPNYAFTSIALGDGQNDVAMLEMADIAIRIISPVNPLPTLERKSGVITSQSEGPQGWSECIEELVFKPLQSSFSSGLSTYHRK